MDYLLSESEMNAISKRPIPVFIGGIINVRITDERDIIEIERRKKLNLFQPLRDELYSVNPAFDGKYTDL